MTFETRSGNTRYVARDSDGNEYTTFREAIGSQAQAMTGRRARIEYHEEQRAPAQTTSTWTRSRPRPRRHPGRRPTPRRPRGARRWTPLPWLVGESEPHEETPPDELYEKLKPFKERVAEDIKDDEPD